MEISPEYSLEGLMLKLKFQCFGFLTRRADSLEKTLMLGKIEDRRRGWQSIRWLMASLTLNGHEFEQAPGDDEGQGSLAGCSPWSCTELDMTERLNNNNGSTHVVRDWAPSLVNSQKRSAALRATIQWGTKPCNNHLSKLESDPPQTEPWDSCSPGQHLDCSLVRDPEPDDPSNLHLKS